MKRYRRHSSVTCCFEGGFLVCSLIFSFIALVQTTGSPPAKNVPRSPSDYGGFMAQPQRPQNRYLPGAYPGAATRYSGSSVNDASTGNDHVSRPVLQGSRQQYVYNMSKLPGHVNNGNFSARRANRNSNRPHKIDNNTGTYQQRNMPAPAQLNNITRNGYPQRPTERLASRERYRHWSSGGPAYPSDAALSSSRRRPANGDQNQASQQFPTGNEYDNQNGIPNEREIPQDGVLPDNPLANPFGPPPVADDNYASSTSGSQSQSFPPSRMSPTSRNNNYARGANREAYTISESEMNGAPVSTAPISGIRQIRLFPSYNLPFGSRPPVLVPVKNVFGPPRYNLKPTIWVY